MTIDEINNAVVNCNDAGILLPMIIGEPEHIGKLDCDKLLARGDLHPHLSDLSYIINMRKDYDARLLRLIQSENRDKLNLAIEVLLNISRRRLSAGLSVIVESQEPCSSEEAITWLKVISKYYLSFNVQIGAAKFYITFKATLWLMNISMSFCFAAREMRRLLSLNCL